MKVVNNARVQLVTVLILSITLDYYARATAEQQQELQDAEVNGAQKSSHKIRFGTKIAKVKSLSVEQVTSPTAAPTPTRPTANQRSAANNPQTAAIVPTLNVPRISRRFDYHQVASPSAQLITQREIPKANKKDFVASANSSHRVQLQRSRGNTRHRSEPARSVPPLQLSEAYNGSAQIQTQGRNSIRSRVVDVNNSNASNRYIGSDQTNRLTQSTKSKAPLSGDPARVKKSTTTTTTQQSLFSRNFQQNNPFNFIPQNFWSLSIPPTTHAPMTTTTTTSPKKLPKKYKHPVVTPTPFDDKFTFQKLQSIKPTEKPNLPRRQNNDGPFRIALPTINFLNPPIASTKQDTEKEKEKRNTVQTLRERFECPRESEVRFQLFPKICKTDKDCSIWNRDELCCEIFGSKSCVNGMPKPLEESSHTPILGLIPRKCPTRPLAELWWDVKECATDNDCWPRVCCPDGRRRYCRTSEPELEVVPVPVKRSLNYLSEYLECTPPPPPIFDLHPKACTSTFDCFPNVCCQEAGLRHCRPPKKSLLTLMANFLNVDFVKRLTQNIVIK